MKGAKLLAILSLAASVLMVPAAEAKKPVASLELTLDGAASISIITIITGETAVYPMTLLNNSTQEKVVTIYAEGDYYFADPGFHHYLRYGGEDMGILFEVTMGPMEEIEFDLVVESYDVYSMMYKYPVWVTASTDTAEDVVQTITIRSR